MTEAITKCEHIPGGHWGLNEPVCASLDKGGLDVSYGKCQKCGKLIEQVFEKKDGKSITYFQEVEDGLKGKTND